VAAKANEGNLFRLEAGETDDFRPVLDIHEMDFSRSVTGFAAAFFNGQLGISDIRGVGRTIKTFSEGTMTLSAFFFADEVFGLCLGKEVKGTRERSGLISTRHYCHCPKDRKRHRIKVTSSHIHTPL